MKRIIKRIGIGISLLGLALLGFVAMHLANQTIKQRMPLRVFAWYAESSIRTIEGELWKLTCARKTQETKLLEPFPKAKEILEKASFPYGCGSWAEFVEAATKRIVFREMKDNRIAKSDGDGNIFLSRELLHDPPEKLAGILVHEAAHNVAEPKLLKDAEKNLFFFLIRFYRTGLPVNAFTANWTPVPLNAIYGELIALSVERIFFRQIGYKKGVEACEAFLNQLRHGSYFFSIKISR